jgi:hypothetical protein
VTGSGIRADTISLTEAQTFPPSRRFRASPFQAHRALHARGRASLRGLWR